MVSSKETTPAGYLASLTPERRKFVAAVRAVVALYMTSASASKARMSRLAAAYKAAGRGLDMGKGCLRYKTLEELPLGVIGDLVASTPVARRIELSEAARQKKK